MTQDWRVAVHRDSTVVLNDSVTCDGFVRGIGTRVQTHIHSDHMGGFTSSLSGKIYCLHGTRDLLVSQHRPYRHRQDLVGLNHGDVLKLDDGAKIQLLKNNHMLGAAQVLYESKEGLRIGYSGDFSWPCEEVIEVDQLVLDGTSGPRTIRNYSQEDAEEAFLELVRRKLPSSPIVIRADVESMFRAVSLLDSIAGVPVILDAKGIRYSTVYAEYGCPVPDQLYCEDSEEGIAAINDGRYVMVRSRGKGTQNWDIEPTYLKLISFGNTPDNPIHSWSDTVYNVGLSNHADFNQSLEYIKATGASNVLVDNSRYGNAIEIAFEIANRFTNIDVDFELKK